MKKILYLFVVAVLLAACTSKNEVRTYNKGKTYVTITYNKTKTEIVTDTISTKDYDEELKVLVENDTVWFHSNLFDEGYSYYDLTFVNKNSKEDDTWFSAKEYSYKEYYIVLELGKFFNIDDIKEISFDGFNMIYDDSINGIKKTNTIYYLDKEQFKQLKK